MVRFPFYMSGEYVNPCATQRGFRGCQVLVFAGLADIDKACQRTAHCANDWHTARQSAECFTERDGGSKVGCVLDESSEQRHRVALCQGYALEDTLEMCPERLGEGVIVRPALPITLDTAPQRCRRG